MNKKEFTMPYLPLFCLMQTIHVQCPGCKQMATIVTDINPELADGFKKVFFDDQHFMNTRVFNANFHCNYCQKHIQYNIDNDSTWLGPYCIEYEGFCTYCNSFDRKQKVRHYEYLEHAEAKKRKDFEVTCQHCGTQEKITLSRKTLRPCRGSDSARDPLFYLPFYFKKTIGTHRELWVINFKHLDYLKCYFTASHIKIDYSISSSSSYFQAQSFHPLEQNLFNRLPKWMKQKRNRKMILKALTDFEQQMIQLNINH